MVGSETQQFEKYRIADLILDIDAVRVLRDKEEIVLPKLSFDLLTAMARHSPAVVSFDQLMDEVWGDVIVGPETVTQRVKLIRHALGDDSANPRYIAPVRGRGYRLIPDAQRIDTTEDTGALQKQRWKKRRTVAVGVAIVAVVIAAWLLNATQSDQSSPSRKIDPRAIAILPFANMSEDTANDALTVGIHDDVLTQVAQIAALKVISRTSVELLDRNQTIPEIARSLGVATVLEGSVQRIDDNVRINVQLIDGETDHHIWSETYDRKLNVTSVFLIQSDIATQIAQSLQATLSAEEKLRLETPPTQNFAAYEAYMLGRQMQRFRNTADLAKAEKYFELAADLDPSYALAYLGLAQTLQLQSTYGTLPRTEANRRSDTLIEKALQLDEQLGEAYSARGSLRAAKLNFDAAEADFEVAKRLAPNHAETFAAYAAMLSFRNRNEEAIENYRKAQSLDPLSGGVNADLGWGLTHAGRYEEALAQFEKTIEIAPEYAGGYRGISDINWTVYGRLDEAYAWRLKGLAIDPGDPVNPAVIGLICLDLGDTELAQHWIDRSLALGADRRRPYWAKEALHMYRGDDAEARVYARHVRALDPRFHYTVTHLRNADIRDGKTGNAIARYEELFPEFLNDADPNIVFWNYISAIDIAYLLQQTGDMERAAMLLSKSLRALEDIRRLGPRGYAIADVEIYALQNKRQLALATLREAVESGWRAYWWFWIDKSPNLDSLRMDPQFQEIRNIITTDMASQLERVRELEPVRK